MILTEDEVNTRLESPLNLVNRLNRLTKTKSNAMDIFTNKMPVIDGIIGEMEIVNDESPAARDLNDNETQVEDLVENAAEKIKLGVVRQRALDVLHDSLGELGARVKDGRVEKARDLATIAEKMDHIINKESNGKNQFNQQVIVYKPIVNEVSKYETILVGE